MQLNNERRPHQKKRIRRPKPNWKLPSPMAILPEITSKDAMNKIYTQVMKRELSNPEFLATLMSQFEAGVPPEQAAGRWKFNERYEIPIRPDELEQIRLGRNAA
jgi:hypothetical protein